MKLRCYCCGEDIPMESLVALVSLGAEEVDRVFLFKPEHVKRVDKPVALVVERRYNEVRK